MNFNIEFQYNSQVIITYFLISLTACFLNYLSHGKSNKLLFTSYRSSPLNPLTYLRLFTHSIGHNNWDHFVSNFLIILLIGPMIEEKFGSLNLLIMLITTSLIVALVNILIHNYISSNAFMLIVLSSFANITQKKIPITLVLICLFYILTEIKKSIFDRNKKIYYSGHILGAVCGIVFGLITIYYPQYLFFN